MEGQWTGNPVEEIVRLNEIFTFFKIHHGKDYEFTGETHNFWELMYVINGSLCVSADDKIYSLSKGGLIFHKPMELHKFYIDDDNGADIMVISFNASGNMMKLFENMVCRTDEKQKSIIDELMGYVEDRGNSHEEFQRKNKGISYDKPLYWATVAAYAEILMMSLAQNNKEAFAVKNADSKLFSRAVQYMNDNICDNPAADDIARNLNVSLSTLKRIFVKYAGLGVHKYFLKLKLKCAINFLDEGYSVTAVSDKLNFSSQGYFTRVFKRETGTLPSEYLNK